MGLAKDYTYKKVKVEIADQVAVVHLYWPDGLRDPAFGGGGPDVTLFHEEMIDALYQLRNDDRVRVVVLRGAGDRYFLSSFAGAEDADPSKRTGTGGVDGMFHSTVRAPQLLEHILKMPKPVIAMVNGDAVGIGATIAMSCDLIFANEDAFITDCHIANHHFQRTASLQQGTVPGDGGAVFWPLAMSTPLAKEFLFTGRPVKARELADMGAINRAVPADQLQDTVDAMVADLLARPAWALGWTKITMNKRVIENFEQTMDLGLAYELMAAQRRRSGAERGMTSL